jgi:hypothetical protein
VEPIIRWSSEASPASRADCRAGRFLVAGCDATAGASPALGLAGDRLRAGLETGAAFMGAVADSGATGRATPGLGLPGAAGSATGELLGETGVAGRGTHETASDDSAANQSAAGVTGTGPRWDSWREGTGDSGLVVPDGGSGATAVTARTSGTALSRIGAARKASLVALSKAAASAGPTGEAALGTNWATVLRARASNRPASTARRALARAAASATSAARISTPRTLPRREPPFDSLASPEVFWSMAWLGWVGQFAKSAWWSLNALRHRCLRPNCQRWI